MCHGRYTGVPQEFWKHAILDYLVRGTDLSSLILSNKKNDNSQHNKSCLVWMNQNYTYFFVDWQKNFFLVCHTILVISLCVPWDDKRLKIAVVNKLVKCLQTKMVYHCVINLSTGQSPHSTPGKLWYLPFAPKMYNTRNQLLTFLMSKKDEVTSVLC